MTRKEDGPRKYLNTQGRSGPYILCMSQMRTIKAFFREISLQLQHDTTNLNVIGGDLNTVLSVQEDRKSCKSVPKKATMDGGIG